MSYVTVTKDIDIDLSDFATKDLVDELLNRKVNVDIGLDTVIEIL